MKAKKFFAGLIAAVMFITSDGNVLNMVHEFAEGVGGDKGYYGYHYYGDEYYDDYNNYETDKSFYEEYYVPEDLFDDYQYGYEFKTIEIDEKYYYYGYYSVHMIDESSDDIVESDNTEIIEETEKLIYRKYKSHVEIVRVNNVKNLYIPAYIDDLPVTNLIFNLDYFKQNNEYSNANDYYNNDYSMNFYSVSVEEGNNFFCCENGVLYNENKTKLLWFSPTAMIYGDFTLPDSVLEIGDFAFYNVRYGINSINPISMKINSNGYRDEFNNCRVLYLNSGLNKIGSFAFCNMYDVYDVILPENVTEIGERAFENCKNIRTFSFLNSDCQVNEIEYLIYDRNLYYINFYIPYKRSLWKKLERLGCNVLKLDLKEYFFENYYDDYPEYMKQEIPISSSFFPDPVFRKYILGFDYDNSNTLSYDELSYIQVIDFSTINDETYCEDDAHEEINIKDIRSFDGLELFFNLSILNIEGCCIDDLVLFNDNLAELYCSGGKICNLEFYGDNLQILDCSHNHINELFVCSYYYNDSNIYNRYISNKEYFNIESSKEANYYDNDFIYYYSFVGDSVKILDCSYNNIQYLKLNRGYDETLYYLGCNNNKIQFLDFERIVYSMNCSNNKIHELNLPNQIRYLDCHSNELEQLDLTGCYLNYLNCSDNNLIDLSCYHFYDIEYLECNNIVYKDFYNFYNLDFLNNKNFNLEIITKENEYDFNDYDEFVDACNGDLLFDDITSIKYNYLFDRYYYDNYVYSNNEDYGCDSNDEKEFIYLADDYRIQEMRINYKKGIYDEYYNYYKYNIINKIKFPNIGFNLPSFTIYNEPDLKNDYNCSYNYSENDDYSIEYQSNDDLEINETNFPDPVFREYISDNFDYENKGYISAEDLANISSLEIDIYNHELKSFEGIKKFKNLNNLRIYISNNTIIDCLDLTGMPLLTDVEIQSEGFIKQILFTNCKMLENVFVRNYNNYPELFIKHHS